MKTKGLSVFFIFILSCSGIGYFVAKGDIKNSPNLENTILISGIELNGHDLSSARVALIMNGKITEGLGIIAKGKNPAITADKNPASSNTTYTGDQNRGYLVFQLPPNINERKTKDFILYVEGITFSGIRSVLSSELSPGAVYGTQKSGQQGWWQAYEYPFYGTRGWRNVNPLGYIEHPDSSFVGCKFSIQKPGIYYLGEIKISANLTIGDFVFPGNIATQKITVGKKPQTAAVNGTMSTYKDIQSFKEFLKTNNLDENIFIDFSQFTIKISHEEYLNFGK
jgi:hypothetical protein